MTATATRSYADGNPIPHQMTPGDGDNHGPQASPDGRHIPRRRGSVYFDWSGGPVHAIHDDSDKVTVYAGLDHLLDALASPTTIRAEATFESFNVAKREEFLARCRREGHDFKVINPRATAKRRRALGYEEKSDEIDARVIRHLATDGITHFTPVVLPDEERVDARQRVNARLMDLRRTKVPRASKRARLGWVFESAKDHYAEALIEGLPPVAALTAAQDAALCTGPPGKRAYSKLVVAAVGVVAEEARNTREFDFLAGLYQNGYPSQVRSDLMLHRWQRAVRGKLPFTDFRRELRWLFHQLRAAAAPTRRRSPDGTTPRPNGSPDGIVRPQATLDGTSNPQGSHDLNGGI